MHVFFFNIFPWPEEKAPSVPRSVLAAAAAVVALVSRFNWTSRFWGWGLKLSDRLDSPDVLAMRRWER
jgi:hypothetical protein